MGRPFLLRLDAKAERWHQISMYQDIREKISTLCDRLKRPEPKLIAVSKRQPNDNVRAVLQQGQRIFGENMVQEAQSKWPDFEQDYEGVELHLLGPLQSNKVNAACELFDYIHSLDRVKLARKLANYAQEHGHCPKVFVQVNTGQEPQKSGVMPDALSAFLHTQKRLRRGPIPLKCTGGPKSCFQKKTNVGRSVTDPRKIFA